MPDTKCYERPQAVTRNGVALIDFIVRLACAPRNNAINLTYFTYKKFLIFFGEATQVIATPL